MAKKTFEPNFQTPPEQFCKEEVNKLNSSGMQGNIQADLLDLSKPDIVWETEQLAKSYGIYMEFNRAETGVEKDWIYMIRISNPGGGPIGRDQWLTIDELSDKHTTDPQGFSSIRLTTRQNIQFHWVKKEGLVEIVKTMAEKGLNSLNGCGDNTRNVMGCPLSVHSDIFNAAEWAKEIGDYFQLPIEPFIKIFAIDPKYIRKPGESFRYGPALLNRKFKIAFSAVHRDPETGKWIPDNCVEALTNDVGIVPIISDDRLSKFQIYIGGGQGERNGKPSMAALAQPFARVEPDQLLAVLDAVVQVHQEWGDRQNRFWARLKYVVKKMGVDWYREKVSARLGFPLEKPRIDLDYGRRHLHFGWHVQPKNGLLTFGAFIENGRLTDSSPNGKLKSMVRDLIKKYPIELMITPNQDLLFTNIPVEEKGNFEKDLVVYGYGKRNGSPYSELRLRSGACVGRDTCRLTYTDSEKLEPYLMDELEKLGWGDMAESIGITGCERQCFRPATKTIGLVGSGMNRYQFKFFGDESGAWQGRPLSASDEDGIYLRSVPKERLAVVCDALFKFYKKNAQRNEGMGAFHRRIGAGAIISYLKENPQTAELMTKPFPMDCVID